MKIKLAVFLLLITGVMFTSCAPKIVAPKPDPYKKIDEGYKDFRNNVHNREFKEKKK